MMKFTFALLGLLFILPVNIVAQTKEDMEEIYYYSPEYITSETSCVIKQFYDIQTVNGVKCQAVIMNNILDGEKRGGLCLKCNLSNGYVNNTYMRVLSYDELEDCIRSLEYFSDTLFTSTPLKYTEAKYCSKNYVIFGAYYKNSKWNPYIIVDGSFYGHKFLTTENIKSFITVMRKAKALIEEKKCSVSL